MKILIPGLVNNVQIQRLKEEAKKRGHVVDGCFGKEIVINASKIEFTPNIRGKSLDSYDLLYLMVTRSRWEWYVASKYLKENHGVKIVNQRIFTGDYNFFLTPAIDYYYQIKKGLPFPKSVIILSRNSVESISKEFKFPVVLKLSNSQQGRGVFKVKSIEELKTLIKEKIDLAPSFIVRKFIENDGDIRVFTVGYKAIGAMKRTSPKGDFRSNISQGGKGSEFDLTKNPKVKEIAEKVSKTLQTEIAGVDIMLEKGTGDPYILEVNLNPQFEGLERYTSANAAEEIIKYFEKLHKGE
ncbi:RimK family alpha-L-glutamate ligase [Patescibacteria group bacterium]